MHGLLMPPTPTLRREEREGAEKKEFKEFGPCLSHFSLRGGLLPTSIVFDNEMATVREERELERPAARQAYVDRPAPSLLLPSLATSALR